MIVVEPHADDAFLSMGELIERYIHGGTAVTIVTVYSGTRNRARDAEAYARAVGAGWYGMDFEEMGDARNMGAARLPPALLFPDALLDDRTWVLPLALTHPEHHEVRERFEQTLPDSIQLRYYLDQPYGSKLKNQVSVSLALRNMRIVDVHRPSARKWRHIPLFKDQAKFFYFNNAETLSKTYELVVRQ